jgi:hypothetical protein
VNISQYEQQYKIWMVMELQVQIAMELMVIHHMKQLGEPVQQLE